MQKKVFALTLLVCLVATPLLLTIPGVKAVGLPVPPSATQVFSDNFESGFGWTLINGNGALEEITTAQHVSGTHSLMFESTVGEDSSPGIQSSSWGVVTPNNDVWLDFYVDVSIASNFEVILPIGLTVEEGIPAGVILSFSLDNGPQNLTLYYPTPNSNMELMYGTGLTSDSWNRITLHVVPNPSSDITAGEVQLFINGNSVFNGTNGDFSALAGAISMWNFERDGGNTYFDDMNVFTSTFTIATLHLTTNSGIEVGGGSVISSGDYVVPQGSIIELAPAYGEATWVIDGQHPRTDNPLDITMNTDHTVVATLTFNALTEPYGVGGIWLQDGFENGIGNWYVDGNPTLSSDAHTGQHSLSVDSQSDAYYDLNTETNYQNIWFNFSVKSGESVTYLCDFDGFNNGNGGYVPDIGFQYEPTLTIEGRYFDGKYVQDYAYDTGVSDLPTSWTTFSLDLQDYTQENATVTLYMNGTAICDHQAAGGMLALDTGAFNEVGLWPSSPVLYDDISVYTQPTDYVAPTPTHTHGGGGGGSFTNPSASPLTSSSPTPVQPVSLKLSSLAVLGGVVVGVVAVVSVLLVLSRSKPGRRR